MNAIAFQSIAAVESVLRAGQMPPLHVHAEDEALRVLGGRLTVYAGDEELELEAGEEWVAPAGVPHTYRAKCGRVRLVTTAPVRSAGRYEDFLRAVAEPGDLIPEEAATLAVLGEAAGITVLGAPGALPGL
ncbi:MAG: cupin domain-containing protein [Gaiellaceae bacterium]